MSAARAWPMNWTVRPTKTRADRPMAFGCHNAPNAMGLGRPILLVEDFDGVAGAEERVGGRVVGDQVDAEPDLAVPVAVAGQGGDRLVALRGGVGVDRGEDAAVAALDGPEGDRADAQAA